MIISKLEMKNFKSHKNTSCNFDRGITLVFGQNGAGKSSIFEAINYALFGGRADNFIRHESKSMKVSMQFNSGGIEYRIERNRTEKSSAARLYRLDSGSEKIESSGSQNVKEDLENKLGFDGTLFRNAVYVRQGEKAESVLADSGNPHGRSPARVLIRTGGYTHRPFSIPRNQTRAGRDRV